MGDTIPVDAAALRRDVTIVVSPKDQFCTAPAHFEALRASAPGIRILHVLCGPMPRQVRAFLEEKAAADPHLELIDSGLDFANPYVLRNLALPAVRTRYVMFLFNDVFPRTERWLADLYEAAEARADADIFQPFIWEGTDEPHASWKSLSFVREGDALHCLQPIAVARGGAPAHLPPGEQPCFLEDHAFLARTAFLAAQSILDPGAAYAKEFLDLALSVRFRGSRIWSVPSSQVLYRVPYRMQPGDLLYFCHRRSWSVSRASVEYIQRKWGFHYRDDGYSVVFSNVQLRETAWSGAQIPAGQLEQAEMMLALFAAIGYDSFQEAELDVPALRRQLGAALANGEQRFGWTMRHRSRVPRYADFTGDFAARRLALRQGRLFPVREDAEARAARAALGLEQAPRPFVLVELQGLEPEAVEKLAPHATLVVRERGVHRAWLHGVAQGPNDLRDLAAAVGNRRTDTTVRLHLSHDSAAPALRVDTDAGAAGWRLERCAWKPVTVSELAALLR